MREGWPDQTGNVWAFIGMLRNSGGIWESNWEGRPYGGAGEVVSPAYRLFQAVAPCRAGRTVFLPDAEELVAEQGVREGEIGP